MIFRTQIFCFNAKNIPKHKFYTEFYVFTASGLRTIIFTTWVSKKVTISESRDGQSRCKFFLKKFGTSMRCLISRNRFTQKVRSFMLTLKLIYDILFHYYLQSILNTKKPFKRAWKKRLRYLPNLASKKRFFTTIQSIVDT